MYTARRSVGAVWCECRCKREREKREEVVEKVRFASGAAQQQASKHVQVRLAGGQRL